MEELEVFQKFDEIAVVTQYGDLFGGDKEKAKQIAAHKSIFCPFLNLFHLLREPLVGLCHLALFVIGIDASTAKSAFYGSYGMWDLRIKHTNVLSNGRFQR